MSISEKPNLNKNQPIPFRSGYLILSAVSTLILLSSILISNLEFSFESKVISLTIIVVTYLIFCIGYYFWQNQQKEFLPDEAENIGSPIETNFAPEISEKLLALDEANLFFNASLKLPDMFRLVSNRIAEIVPYTNCVLFLADKTRTRLKAAQFTGEDIDNFSDIEMNFQEGLAGGAFSTRQVVLDSELLLEKKVIPAAALRNLKTAIAAPLIRSGGESFGALALYSNEENAFDGKTSKLLKEISERVSPLLLSSLTFERNLDNALTDTLTSLPNERAFYLVLENQVAESQRFKDQRALTVLSLDIKGFEDFNRRFGHAAGDRVLAFAAKIIKGQLRQMDFLARSAGDEFVAVLPTASEEITKVIIDRIERAFAANAFELAGNRQEFVKLNFGAASFLKDGETAEELLKRAILKKQQSKSTVKGSILWFPQELPN